MNMPKASGDHTRLGAHMGSTKLSIKAKGPSSKSLIDKHQFGNFPQKRSKPSKSKKPQQFGLLTMEELLSMHTQKQSTRHMSTKEIDASS